jgi:excisionase family DNA binding protein
MTSLHSWQKWRTSRVWPGGGWGEAFAQVRKDQRLGQRDIADYIGVSTATLRKWENGEALPDRDLWQRVEEAMGMPVPDPRVPDHTPAERDLIDTMLLMIDELRLLRERMVEIAKPETPQPPPAADGNKLLDVKAAAAYLGVSPSMIRTQIAAGRLKHHRIGSRIFFKPAELDQIIDQGRSQTGAVLSLGARPAGLRGWR